MTIERARVLPRPKPWGLIDLGQWSHLNHSSELIGELSYERADASAPATSLLLKLLFTSAPLSIQVHPDDIYAQSMGLPHGKSEVWLVLDAAPGAKVALGLNRSVTRNQLREAVQDGSIEQLVQWQVVKTNDIISVPAGTIHAIGAGLVIAEIQQRSDATFRLFDYGRDRTMHATDGAAVARLETPELQIAPKQLSDERALLAANPHFVFERLALQPGSEWRLDATNETWLLAINGEATIGTFKLAQGCGAFARGEWVDIRVDRSVFDLLVAYTGSDGPSPRLLQRIATQTTPSARLGVDAPIQPNTIGVSP